ncbi:MAG: FKBP-type peptidyl-prolyl cis-trans isomerase [Bacteroidota bacterium]
MRYLLFLVALTTIWACQSEPTATMTPSGYSYTHHTKNDGPKPQKGEEVVFTVDIRSDEQLMQSTRDQGQPARAIIPMEEQPGRSISPIIEALQLMSVGDSLTVLQPVDSFARKPPGFENSMFVHYDVVLNGITSKEEIDKQRAEQQQKMEAAKARENDIAAQTEGILNQYKSKSLSGLKATDSGLKYYLIEAGTGKQVENGSRAAVHYYGMTMEAKEFDNSFKRGTPYPVPVGRGQVIKGWDEGLQLFKEGAKAVLFIPSELGYGAAGSPPVIQPNAELVFYVEIEEVL